MALIDECRGEQNKLGLGYQLGFVRLFNQFPPQVPFEPIERMFSTIYTLRLKSAGSIGVVAALLHLGVVQTFVSPGAIEKNLAAKRMPWVTLGKPKGTIQKSKFDKDREKINKLLKLVSTPTISRSTPTLTKEATVFPMALGNTNVCTTPSWGHL